MINNRRINLEALKTIAKQVLPSGGQAWLYGSRARGDNHDDSDWDLLILLDKDRISNSDYDNIGFPFSMLGWENGEAIVPIIYTKSQWQEQSFTPFFKNVEQDKILIA